MPNDIRFRLSFYLTLATAGLALAVAEHPLLPGFLWFALPLLALLAVAFFLEGRWTLPVWATNVLAVLIFTGWAVWVYLQLFDETDPWRDSIPFPAALLPVMGPLLLLLVLVRLLRPKERRDFWALQALGLLEVGLACVLGFTPAFGGLLFAYVVCALGSLALFEQRGGAAGGQVLGAAVRRSWIAVPAAATVLWAGGTTAVALGLCLLLPRGGIEPWNPLQLAPQTNRTSAPGAAQTGASDLIDLNRTGWVDVDDTVALTVTAQDAEGNPKRDLSVVQRWRGPILDRYQNGRWDTGFLLPMVQPGLAGPASNVLGRLDNLPEIGSKEKELFNLGPSQYFLTFDFDPLNAGGLFLAEPIVTRDPGPQPKMAEASVKVSQTHPAGISLFLEFEGTLVPAVRARRGKVKYRQVTMPLEEPDLVPAVDVRREYAHRLTEQPVPGLTDWTKDFARRVAAVPGTGVTPADLEWEMPADPQVREYHPDGILAQSHWEKVARALAYYLAHGGEYTYSLELRRQDKALDPTFDFLANVKEGHCNRYAGGLALMLRALGIPSRLVMGFRGCEHNGDGTYEVHHSQAHAWVEVLVSRPGPEGKPRWYWLQLDPTPGGEARRPTWLSVAHWWERGQEAGQLFWRFFVVDYGPEQQEQFWNQVGGAAREAAEKQAGGAGLPSAWWLLGLGLVPPAALGALLVRRFRPRRRPRRAVSPVAGYARLLAILDRRRGLRPAPSQTPREFAAAVVPALGALPAELAALPAEVAELLYRVRFGGRPLGEAEGRSLDGRLGQLDAALAAR